MSRAETPADGSNEFTSIDSATSRVARVSKGLEGEPLGLTIFLTPSELARLGADIDDCDEVEYRVQDGRLDFEPIRTSTSE